MHEEHAVVQVTQKAIFISPDRKVLLLQTPNELWELPGGRLNINELWEDGLRREIFEETGLKDFAICGIVGVGNWKSSRNDSFRYGVFFCCSIDDVFAPRLSSEHPAYAWVKECDIEKYQLNLPMVYEMVNRAFCF